MKQDLNINISQYFTEHIKELADKIETHIKKQRWFRSKDKEIKLITIEDIGIEVVEDRNYIFLFLNITFSDNSFEVYFLPMIATYGSINKNEIFHTKFNSKIISFLDALSDYKFNFYLLEKIKYKSNIILKNGTIEFSFNNLNKINLNDIKITSLNLEQTNTSILFNEEIFFKVFRKIDCGDSPELEMLTFINENGFNNIPKILGYISYEQSKNKSTIGIFENYIENISNAWEFTVQTLNAIYNKYLNKDFPEEKYIGELIKKDFKDFLSSIKRIGELTGKLHATLGLETNNSLIKKEIVSKDDVEKYKLKYKELLEEVMFSLEKKINDLGDLKIKDNLNKVLINKEKFLSLGENFSLLLNDKTCKIRLHGDYHLGQILYTGNDFVIFDFEGEPIRELSERKEKNCSLKDVASMLRSFNYAACFSEFEFNKISRDKNINLIRVVWEKTVREVFLKSYFSTCIKNNLLFLSEENNMKLIKLYEIEKAFYELKYELNNRPGWIFVPLEFIVKAVEG